MAEFEKKTYYFKLTGRKVYYFKVDRFDFIDANLCFLTCLNNNAQVPLTRGLLESTINKYMTEHGLKYEDLKNDEIEKVKLFYEPV